MGAAGVGCCKNGQPSPRGERGCVNQHGQGFDWAVPHTDNAGIWGSEVGLSDDSGGFTGTSVTPSVVKFNLPKASNSSPRQRRSVRRAGTGFVSKGQVPPNNDDDDSSCDDYTS
eukprot:CAMPEP_0170607232 /NCGR_PEP_ID=MMETSP0224-20130122/20943_1 /TAXON_ID=285029 /ORGANISM="Togula jolla, Strain CCCM 725" /LENGTH=113 /DNA_ID=CAMNT_0010932381 /DNA_START=58 /DNA_END=399 /DNA_ORIENTATION=+